MGRKYERKTLRKRDANVIKLALIEVTEKQGYLSERLASIIMSQDLH